MKLVFEEVAFCSMRQQIHVMDRLSQDRAVSFTSMLLIFGIIFSTAGLMGAPEPEYYSPECLCGSPDGKLIYVAESKAKRVGVVNAEQGVVVANFGVPQEPTGLALSPSGRDLWVTVGADHGELLRIDPKQGSIVQSVEVGHSPCAPVIAGNAIYVCSRFKNEIVKIDLPACKVAARIPVAREPVAAVMTRDGRRLFVANLLPNGSANASPVSCSIDVIDINQGVLLDSIPLPNGTVNVRGICLSLDDRTLYVGATVARFMLATTTVERGWMNSSALNLIDVNTRKLRYSLMLDEETKGAPNPWAVACSPDGKWICISHAGTHEVSMIEQKALWERLSHVPARPDLRQGDEEYEALPDNPAEDFHFLDGIRKRIQLIGNGPRGMAIVGNQLWVAECFSGSLGRLDLNTFELASLALGSKQTMTLERRGEMLFHDAKSMCFQQWQSCSTCHPEGRMDGVNWDLLNDGIGNPKNTRSLLFTPQTPKMMARGVRSNARECVRAGMKFIQFIQPRENVADALLAYMGSLTPMPSPWLVEGRFSEAAVRGERIFEQAECASCHSGEYYTNKAMTQVGVRDEREPGVTYVVPTLREVWRTAPYLHDGRAATIMDVLTGCNKQGLHGKVDSLSRQELQDLVEYVNSL